MMIKTFTNARKITRGHDDCYIYTRITC